MFKDALFYRWRPHPWHGLEPGPDPPRVVTAYIEITPFDLVKYEVDKTTGYLRVDRPQRTSSLPPTLYGLVPQTYCDRRVGELMPDVQKGDGDPLDICVISDRPINRTEVMLSARVVGGLQLIDNGLADDKIVAVLLKDDVWANIQDIADLPKALVKRLEHYFSTYKLIPGETKQAITFKGVYGHEQAYKVIEAAMKDYEEAFPQQ